MRRLLTLVMVLLVTLAFFVPTALAEPNGSKTSVPESRSEQQRAKAKLEKAGKSHPTHQTNVIQPLAEKSQGPLSTAGYIPQPDQNTCGPTAAANLLQNWGFFKTVDEMKPLVGYSETYEETPWSDQFMNGINSVIGDSWYVRMDAPTQTQLWTATWYDIDRADPFIINVVMESGGTHLPGYYLNTTYGHYVTGNGYSGDGSEFSLIYYFDQYDRSMFYTVDPTVGNPYGQEHVSLKDLQIMTSTRGIVW